MAVPFVLSEKRALPRRELLFYLRVTEPNSAQEIGRLIDIHSKGILLMSRKPLELGRVYNLCIEPPKALQSKSINSIDIKAKSVWIKRSLTLPYMENGLMIIDKSNDAEEAIDLLINLFALPDGGLKA
ncbi:MAG: hypothetical protein LBE31_05615 [Deltaproteobacteria bacterium]|jgi:hypothetical protein|nr:hypothetical protein [Deltaproteobacteria bacterium]